jgi:hypothetical protein
MPSNLTHFEGLREAVVLFEKLDEKCPNITEMIWDVGKRNRKMDSVWEWRHGVSSNSCITTVTFLSSASVSM